jgi:hypothetical protein
LNGDITDKDNWFDHWGPRGSRHLLNVSGIVDLPRGIQLSFISTFASAPPLNAIVSGIDFNGDGTSGDRLPGTTQNQLSRGVSKKKLVRLVADFNRDFAGTTTARGQTIPVLDLPATFDFGDSLISQDLRLSRAFKYGDRITMTVAGEVFNLFNFANLSGYSGNLRESSLFGQASTRVDQVFGSGGPRAFQVAARVRF